MKYVFFVLMLALVSCSRDYSQFQNAEYSAMSASELPLYKGITDIMKGSSFKTLTAGTQVYLTTDSATGNGIKYVKVIYGDSSAYTLAHLLLPHGQWAVITANPGNYSVNVYDEPSLGNIRKSIDDDWALVVAGDQSGDVVPVMFDGEDGEPAMGYVPSNLVYADEASVTYYKEYLDAQDMYQAGSSQPLKDLFTNPEFSGLRLAQWRSAIAADLFDDVVIDERGDAEAGEGETMDADAVEEIRELNSQRVAAAKESGWMRGNNPVSETPGTIKKYFVFEDDTEMRAEGYELANASPWRADDNSITKTVKSVRFEVTPATKSTVKFDFNSFFEPSSEYNTSWTRTFENAEANKPVSVLVPDINESMIFCSVMRMRITVGDLTAIATVSGDCGD